MILVLLAFRDAQITAAEAKMAQLLPDTPFALLITVPGWGTVRAANYDAAVGDLERWRGAPQLYRASGLPPAQTSRLGSVMTAARMGGYGLATLRQLRLDPP